MFKLADTSVAMLQLVIPKSKPRIPGPKASPTKVKPKITAQSTSGATSVAALPSTGLAGETVADTPTRDTVAVSFCTRRGRSDLSGGSDNAVTVDQLSGYDPLPGGLRLAAGLDSERR